MTSKKEHRKLNIVGDLRAGDFIELDTLSSHFKKNVGILISIGTPKKGFAKIVMLASEKVLTYELRVEIALTPKEIELNDA